LDIKWLCFLSVWVDPLVEDELVSSLDLFGLELNPAGTPFGPRWSYFGPIFSSILPCAFE
jgi:hypothetical protein